MSIESLEDRRVLSADFGSAFAIPGAFAYDVALDASGNTITVGVFVGTVDFDNGPGTYNLTSSGDKYNNTFVAKYDPAGNFVWARRMGGESNNFGPRFAVGNNGDIFVTGSFTNTADFGSTVLAGLGEADPYVTKLDTDGNFLWAKRLSSGPGSDYGNSVAIDGSGSAFVIGELHSSVTDTFITKLDTFGTTLWTKQFGTSSSGRGGGWTRGFEITVDGVGNVSATGKQGGTVDFDPGAGVISSAGDAFVLKMNSGGSVVWARSFAKQGSIASVQPQGIAVDTAGNVYSTGSFFLGGIDFDPGKPKHVMTANDGAAMYVSKLDATGNFVWARMANGPSDEHANGLALDGGANVYITGDFASTVDFDPGAGASNLTSAGSADIVLWSLDSGGSFRWAVGMGGTASDIGRGLTVDSSGIVYTTGSFTGPADFDPSPTGAYTLTGSGLFVSKLVQTAPPAMTMITETQTATGIGSGVSSPASPPATSTTLTDLSTARVLLFSPARLQSRSKVADAAFAASDDSLLDTALEDDLLVELAAAR